MAVAAGEVSETTDPCLFPGKGNERKECASVAAGIRKGSVRAESERTRRTVRAEVGP